MPDFHFNLSAAAADLDAELCLQERIVHTELLLAKLRGRLQRFKIDRHAVRHHQRPLFEPFPLRLVRKECHMSIAHDSFPHLQQTAPQISRPAAAFAAPPSELPCTAQALRRLDQMIQRTSEIITRYLDRANKFSKRLHQLNLQRLQADNQRRQSDPLYQAGLAEIAGDDDDDDLPRPGRVWMVNKEAGETAAPPNGEYGIPDPTQGDGDHLPTLDPDPEFADLIEREAQAELNAAIAQDGHSRRTAEEEAMEHLHSDETCDASGDA